MEHTSAGESTSVMVSAICKAAVHMCHYSWRRREHHLCLIVRLQRLYNPYTSGNMADKCFSLEHKDCCISFVTGIKAAP